MATEIVFQDGADFLVLFVDATLSEEHKISASVTKHPVAAGVDFTDHLAPNADPVVLDVVISDTPTDGSGDGRELTRTRDAWELLEDARDRALLALVSMPLKTYDDCLLVDASTTKTAADGTWLKARLTFQPIVTVRTETVDDPEPDRARDCREENEGSVATQDAPDELVSLLASGVVI